MPKQHRSIRSNNTKRGVGKWVVEKNPLQTIHEEEELTTHRLASEPLIQGHAAVYAPHWCDCLYWYLACLDADCLAGFYAMQQ